ncbi:MAG TPA: YdeI/OmpD-associated family protein [Candidatus Saccharimonadales bacterium]|nr:YdeI/OmpD-associated family protein [Candidatus Saccharimonadales bacterium]
MNTTTDLPIIAFVSQKDWEMWLETHHEKEQGIWIQFFKKNSGIVSITYMQAVETALCYGWIDSQAKSFDEKSYLQKFTPRRSKSIWSKVNTQRIERLLKEGKMKPAGLKQIEEAKQDGRWEAAYNSPSTIIIPEDFLKELSKNKKAQAFFETLNKTNTYAIAWRLETAKKPETREKRMKMILEMLGKGEKFH